MVKTLLPAKVTRTPFWKDTRWWSHKFNGCMRCDWSAMPWKNRLGMCSRLVGSTSTFFDTLSHKLLYSLGLNTQQSFSLTPQQKFLMSRSITWLFFDLVYSLQNRRQPTCKSWCKHKTTMYSRGSVCAFWDCWFSYEMVHNIYSLFYKIILPG